MTAKTVAAATDANFILALPVLSFSCGPVRPVTTFPGWHAPCGSTSPREDKVARTRRAVTTGGLRKPFFPKRSRFPAVQHVEGRFPQRSAPLPVHPPAHRLFPAGRPGHAYSF